MSQLILNAHDNYEELKNYLNQIHCQNILLVCDKSISFLPINKFFKELKINIIRFSDFQPNPLYESVVKGVHVFLENHCDVIIAVGGGSAIDVAKCIKLYSHMNHTENYLDQEIIENNVTFIAVPTTAGTGSEATKYAVIYYNGEKQSIIHDSCIPKVVILDPHVLETLPIYQKKVTMMDALCHSIESFWSVNSTKQSQEYSKKAIQLILKNIDSYLSNELNGNQNMLKAAYIAGKAINITQTTAGHAMSYKLTSLYGIAHGHAVAICLSKLWPYMINHLEDCIDYRGEDYLRKVFKEIAVTMNCSHSMEAAELFNKLLERLDLSIPDSTLEDIKILTYSVNPVRLKNNPIQLNVDEINNLYYQILKK